jgi:hypothetical protein
LLEAGCGTFGGRRREASYDEVTVGRCLAIVAGDDERFECRPMLFDRRRLDLETRVDATRTEGGVP